MAAGAPMGGGSVTGGMTSGVTGEPGNGRRVGRRRTRDERIPIWFGLPFLGMGLLAMWFGSTEGLQASGVFVIGIGGLFALVGAALVWTAIRERRPSRVGGTAMPNVGKLDVERFTRSPMQILIDLVIAPIGGIGFLAMAVFVVVLVPILGLVMATLPAFFGVLLLRGSLVTIRRGVRFTIAEIGPRGIWLPDIGRTLAWDEIAEIRLEDLRGVGGPNNSSTAVYRWLGIVPKDEDLIRRAPSRGASGMVRGYMRLVNTMKPGTGMSDPAALAPYGISATEVEQPFEAVVRSVERFATVRGQDAPTVAEAPPLDSTVASLLGASGLGGSLGRSVLTGLPIAGSPAPTRDSEVARPEPAPARAFRRSEGFGATYSVLFQVPGIFLWIGLPAVFLVLWTAAGGLAMPWYFYPLLLVPVLFMLDGVAQLLELAGRIRMTRGDRQLLAIDARGIELRGMGHLRWDQVAAVRVVDSSMPNGESSPPGRRLEIVPRDLSALDARPWTDRAFDRYRTTLRRLKPFGDRTWRGPAFGLDLDLLEATSDEVLDAIARYTLVEET